MALSSNLYAECCNANKGLNLYWFWPRFLSSTRLWINSLCIFRQTPKNYWFTWCITILLSFNIHVVYFMSFIIINLIGVGPACKTTLQMMTKHDEVCTYTFCFLKWKLVPIRSAISFTDYETIPGESKMYTRCPKEHVRLLNGCCKAAMDLISLFLDFLLE